MADQELCCVDGCDKPIRYKSRKLCQGHYLRLLRHGDVSGGAQYNKTKSPDGVCLAPDCEKPVHKDGRHCSMHAARLRIHGSLDKGAFQPRGSCTLDGCERPHYGQGYCVKHYKRFYKYGDPLAGSTEWGAVRRWLDDVAVPYEGDECLTFPYSRDGFGYGKIRLKGGNVGAHVYVCRATNGEKPTPSHEACHSCGNGNEGCVTPRHLRWGTRSDNVQDAIRHGTFARDAGMKGEAHPHSKLTDADVVAIRAAFARGEPATQIAKRHGIHFGTAYQIKYRNTWKHLP